MQNQGVKMKSAKEIQAAFDAKLQSYLFDIENNNIIGDERFIAFLDFSKDIGIISQNEQDRYIKKAKELRGDYFLATKIIMDEEKILREDIYELEAVYAKIDELAHSSGMIKKR